MNEKIIEERFDAAKKEKEFLPFFENKVKDLLLQINEIEYPYIFPSKGHGCVEIEFEKMWNKKESNYVAIDFYENEIEIYMTKYRKDKIQEYPTDCIKFSYDDNVVDFINTECEKFINEKSNTIYEVSVCSTK